MEPAPELRPEQADRNDFRPRGPLTLEQRSGFINSVLDDIDELPNDPSNNPDGERFRRAVYRDLGRLPVTSFESPGDTDPSFGNIAAARLEISAIRPIIEGQRNARPKSSKKPFS